MTNQEAEILREILKKNGIEVPNGCVCSQLVKDEIIKLYTQWQNGEEKGN